MNIFIECSSPIQDNLRGKGGPVNVVTIEPTTSAAKGFFEAGKELGYNLIDEAGSEAIGEFSCSFISFLILNLVFHYLFFI